MFCKVLLRKMTKTYNTEGILFLFFKTFWELNTIHLIGVNRNKETAIITTTCYDSLGCRVSSWKGYKKTRFLHHFMSFYKNRPNFHVLLASKLQKVLKFSSTMLTFRPKNLLHFNPQLKTPQLKLLYDTSHESTTNFVDFSMKKI